MMSIHILLLSNTDRVPYGSLICFSDPELQPPPVRAIHTLEWPPFLQRDYERANQETNLQRQQCRSDTVERLVGKTSRWRKTTLLSVDERPKSIVIWLQRHCEIFRNNSVAKCLFLGGSWHTILTDFACQNIRCDHCTTLSHSRAF